MPQAVGHLIYRCLASVGYRGLFYNGKELVMTQEKLMREVDTVVIYICKVKPSSDSSKGIDFYLHRSPKMVASLE